MHASRVLRALCGFSIAAGLTVTLSVCGGDSQGPGTGGNGGSGPTLTMTSYDGTFASSGGENGSFSVTIGVPSDLSTPLAFGWIRKTGVTQTLAGSYVPGSGVIQVAGGAYSLQGNNTGGQFQGTYTGPVGSGALSGFSRSSTSPPVRYCGNWSGSGVNGSWNFTLRSNQLLGVASIDGGNTLSTGVGPLNGTAAGSAVSITFDGGTASGNISGSNVSGTWTAPDPPGPPFTGIWQGVWCGGSSGAKTLDAEVTLTAGASYLVNNPDADRNHVCAEIMFDGIVQTVSGAFWGAPQQRLPPGFTGPQNIVVAANFHSPTGWDLSGTYAFYIKPAVGCAPTSSNRYAEWPAISGSAKGLGTHEVRGTQ